MGDAFVLNVLIGKDTSTNIDCASLLISNITNNISSRKDFANINLFYSNVV